MTSLIQCVAIFAGGQGLRLKNSEVRPKPFVDLIGKPLVRRVIDQFLKLSSINKVFLLTCASNYTVENFIGDHFCDIDVCLCEEQEMSGKLGAMQFFYNSNSHIDTCLFANADTLFLNERELLSSLSRLNLHADIPTVLLANPDSTRSDYRKVNLDINGKLIEFQNSGAFIASRSWTYSNYLHPTISTSLELDEILLSQGISDFVFVDSDILDIGTPQRLQLARELIDDNN